MALSDKEKVEFIKRTLMGRIGNIGTLPVIKTLMQDLAWPKIKNLLDVALQDEADQQEIKNQKGIARKANILAFKEEKDAY